MTPFNKGKETRYDFEKKEFVPISPGPAAEVPGATPIGRGKGGTYKWEVNGKVVETPDSSPPVVEQPARQTDHTDTTNKKTSK
jgi:hypothetical protein